MFMTLASQPFRKSEMDRGKPCIILQLKCFLYDHPVSRYLIIFTALVLFSLQACERECDYDTVYFNQKLKYGSVTDIDGNIYRTIRIGSREWMAENLRVTHYRDNSDIRFVKNDSDWVNLRSGGYCVYKNDNSIVRLFGNLYNYYSISNTHEICPEGWHLPSIADINDLSDYLGGKSTAGIKLKEKGSAHWGTLNYRSTNGSGFTALPGGMRDINSIYHSIGDRTLAYRGGAGYWWCSDHNDRDSAAAWSYCLGSNTDYVLSSDRTPKRLGISVRCVRN
jgi:uncharacterized protein (TIGR02145 family)